MKKEIIGYNGKYTIDNYGNIYSNGIKMSPYKINSGYLAIKLRNKGTVKAYLIHRLVAEYFLEGSGVVDHIDGNRLNNRVENLDFKGHKFNSGNNHYKAVFTLEQVKYIRECREIKGMRNKDIYKLFPSISHTAIDQVLNYKTYKIIPC